jgi:hypothetical protein
MLQLIADNRGNWQPLEVCMFYSISEVSFDECGRAVLTDESLLREVTGGVGSGSADMEDVQALDGCGVGCGDKCCN